mmetsp:Transcript_5291/g.3043  ORF Transcript_5291/g.3043 Transcript_5291/m.3043 type:complete len:90 (+) Transcript_5291:370-639(+)
MTKEKDECLSIVEAIIDAEESYLFTNDVDYLTRRTDIIPKSDKKKPTSIFVDEIRERIDSYFNIVIRNVRDTVPKIVGTFLVKAVMESI